ncbi:MAG: heme-binding domain-containing protein [Caldilineaceae bacterium]|nr:heme-binding domain-containing protein [Caldilineaceae bacterium]MBP8106751.1 heme-binding domain-containing protein [Caldilineaceae bacterium]MBP8123378.1 heme-binding domain-containing protein [Caldilineaceae bacterium]MBP9073421.1 heme-binding domain-containing protein [Caldilineaceae bacterium]
MLKKLVKHWKRTLLILVAVFLVVTGLASIPLVGNNPPVVSTPNWDSPATEQLAMTACGDCHSNLTEWPWYSYVPPVSFLVGNHTREGRTKLNFSDWIATTRRLEADEIKEVITDGEMPPWDFLLMHPEAKLTVDQQTALIDGLTKTLANK